MELKTNSGAIFKNANKKSDSSPDYRGECDRNGQRFEIALWLRTSEKGVKYFACKLSDPYNPEPKPSAPEPVVEADEPDDLPF